jgi:hypothetical protein
VSTPSEPPVDPWAVPVPGTAPPPAQQPWSGPPTGSAPPPGYPQYGPPPGYPQYGPPPGYPQYGLPPQPQVPRTFRPLDGGVIALAGAAFVASFLPYVGLSLKLAGFGFDYTVNAWHSYAILGLLALFAAGAATIAGVVGAVPAQRLGFGIAAAGAAALGTFLVLVRGLTYGQGVQLRWGGWVLIVVGVAETVCAVAGAAAAATAGRQPIAPP